MILNRNKGLQGKSSLAHKYITFMLMLSFYYLFYRYPFKFNSAGTSQSYNDTPLFLMTLKYIIFIIICVYYFLKASIFLPLVKIKLSQAIELIIFLYLFTYPFICFLLLNEIFLLKTGVFFLAIIPLFIFRFKDVFIDKLCKYVIYFIIISIIFEIIQLILFFYFERLPALAYKDSLLVRFGSVWDDPNGYSFILIFLIAFVIYGKFKTTIKFSIGLILCFMLILTQSFTGIGAAIGTLIIINWIFIFFHKEKRTSKHFLITIIITFLSLAILGIVVNTDLFSQLLLLKYDSISEHINVIYILRNADLLQFLGLSPYGLHGESGYINMLLNFGLLYLLFFFYIGFITIKRLLKIINYYNKSPGGELYYGIICFTIAYYIGMLNLPLDTVFPLNLVFILFLILSNIGINNIIPETDK